MAQSEWNYRDSVIAALDKARLLAGRVRVCRDVPSFPHQHGAHIRCVSPLGIHAYKVCAHVCLCVRHALYVCVWVCVWENCMQIEREWVWGVNERAVLNSMQRQEDEMSCPCQIHLYTSCFIHTCARTNIRGGGYNLFLDGSHHRTWRIPNQSKINFFFLIKLLFCVQLF